jgi:predicted CoA-binding protein
MIIDSPSGRAALLDKAKTVAIVGASDNPARASYFVLRYLKMHGYSVYPVNPNLESVDGEKAYPSLEALIEAHGAPDIVDVFRRPEALPELVEEAIAGGVKVMWFQYGVVNRAAIERADRAGLTLVVDRCMKVEHARFSRALSSQGFDSGIISSRRRPVQA